jgi:hypothetical protein
MEQNTKCFSVNLSIKQVAKLKRIREKSGKTQNRILTEAVDFGLRQEAILSGEKVFYLVKARIDTARIMELAQKLQTGELDTSMLVFTYCIKDDPTVGVSLWLANDKKQFDELFKPHRKYYKEIIDVREVIMPEESLKLILADMR